MQKLAKFAKANTSAIQKAALRAMDLGKDPSRALRDMFVINLHSSEKSESSTPKTAYVVADGRVISARDTGAHSGSNLKLLADDNNRAKSMGYRGAIIACFVHDNKNDCSICLPIAFADNIFQPDTSTTPWLMQLKSEINGHVASV
jgi:hypothetical protein